MATEPKAPARKAPRKKFKSGRAAPDRPQLMDDIAAVQKKHPHLRFERTPQEDGSVVVAMTDYRMDPPRAVAIGEGADTAAAVADLNANMPKAKAAKAGGAK